MVVVTYYGNTTTGHVALSLTGLDKQLNIHISIYPPNRSVPNLRLHTVELDGPDEVTEIMVLPSEESCGYGLSEQAIQHWWRHEFDPRKSNSYSLFGRNCASAVYAALEIGQKKSESLGHEAITYDTYTISFPSNIARYAKKVIEHIRKKCPAFDELHLEYAKLKEYCSAMQHLTPYEQTVVIYSRLMQFKNLKEYCLTINKPFCDGIKKTLLQFKASIEKSDDVEVNYYFNTINIASEEENKPDSSNIDRLIDLTNTEEGDIEAYFSRLRDLGDYIYKNLSSKGKDLIHLLNDAIKKELLTPLPQYIQRVDLSSIKEKERMKESFALLKDKIDDQSNPHSHYISQVTDMFRAMFGLS